MSYHNSQHHNLNIGLNKQISIKKAVVSDGFEDKLKKLETISQQSQNNHRASEWSKQFSHIKDRRERARTKSLARYYNKVKPEQTAYKYQETARVLKSWDFPIFP